jgi:hypothetical protein
MRTGEKTGRLWIHVLVGAVITAEAATNLLRGPQPAVAAVYGTLIVGGMWAWNGRDNARRGVGLGVMAQHMTWDAYVRPHRAPPDANALHTALVARMAQADDHVRAFAAHYRLEKVSIAATGDRFGSVHDAASSRYGSRAHLWLGLRWFHPLDTGHLPVLLEHELAHIRRGDTGRRLTTETAAVVTVVLAAGLLPLPSAALTTVTVSVLLTLARWWAELACDTHAVRACGRTAAIAMWTLDIDKSRTQPLRYRVWNGLLALRTHPPFRLRRWWARHVPVAWKVGPSPCHPLSMPPGTEVIAARGA